MKHGKKYVEAAKLIDRSKLYEPDEAIELAKKAATAKFDETIWNSMYPKLSPRPMPR